MITNEAGDEDEGPASACRVADLLLEMGSVLLASGAHCGRVRRNIERVAEKWGYKVELFLSFTGLMLSIKDTRDPARRVARFKSCPLHGVHFGKVTEISLLTWSVLEQDVSIDDTEKRLKEIKAMPHYPRRTILIGLGAACACLCMLAGGNWKDAGIAFIATFCGMFVRQEILRLRFNPMIGFIAASFTTTLIAGLDMVFHIGASPEKALATSVLYLIPGVPLINCTIDLIEGYIPTSTARGVYGGFILLCIAVGMSMSILFLGIYNETPAPPAPHLLSWLLAIRDVAFALVVAVGFAILFSTPRRVLYMAGFLGGLGHCIRFVLLQNNLHIVPATLAGAVFIGLAGIFCAHRVHAPPVVFTMPACITMIPGLYAYRAMLGCVKMTDLEKVMHDPTIIAQTAHYFVLTASLLFSLAIGICSGALIFRKKSVKLIFKRTM
jgi:uncharacterized membrane protein YjjP (DUF1212 family)